MSFRIDYYRGDQKVMAAACPKALEDAKADAQAGLTRYDAERAVIRDMRAYGKEIAVVKR